MRKITVAAALSLLCSGAALAEIAQNEITTAMTDASVLEVFEAMNAVEAAIVAGDAETFAAAFSADALVNSPSNAVTTGAEAAARFRAGMIDYHSMKRRIEGAQSIAGGYVVVMGEEEVTPKDNAPNAGKIVRRRFTDVWRKEASGWKLAVRQATVISVE
jgi:ketosteroid isomerase-like protein